MTHSDIPKLDLITKELNATFPANILKNLIQKILDEIRVFLTTNSDISVLRLDDYIEKDKLEIIIKSTLNNKNKNNKERLLEIIISVLQAHIESLQKLPFEKLYNATGVVLQTNLGRALLDDEIINISEFLSNYTNLEFDLKTGKRGHRDSHLSKLLKNLLDCEDAIAVNNNASAVLLILNTFANRKNVIISRGELVEVGGSFRIPEVMKSANAKIIEIGATNKTRLEDYKNAIEKNKNIGLIMRAHQSNFRQVGFTSIVDLGEIIELCNAYNLIDYYDLGGGYLGFGNKQYGKDLSLEEIMKLRPSLVSFSGDKLFGSVQAGIICGKKELIDKLRKNHLMRALRLDKLSILALSHTITNIFKNKLPESVKMLDKEPKALKIEAKKLFQLLKNENLKNSNFIDGEFDLNNLKIKNSGTTFDIFIARSHSLAGGGSLPTLEFDSYALCIICKRASKLIEILRQNKIIARAQKDAVVFDMRALKDLIIIKDLIIKSLNEYQERK